MQVDAIFIPAETPVASNASRPSSPAALSFGATLASSISSSAPPNLEGPIKHQSADGQSVKGQSAQRQSAQSQSDQARSEQDLSVIDRVAAQSGAAASVESKSSLPVAPGLSVTSGPTLISNLNSNSAIKAAAKLAPRSPVSPTATGVVPAASFPAFELLGPFTPVPNLPDPPTPDPATNEQPLAGQLRANLGGASVSGTKDLDLLQASSNVLNSNPVNRPAFSFAPTEADSISTAPTEVVPAAAGAGASLAYASLPAFELLVLSTPLPNLPDPATPDPATPQQSLAGQLRANLGGAGVSATKDLDRLPASSNVLNSNPVSRPALSFAPTGDGSQFAESPAAVGPANSNPASKTAYSLPNLSAQPSIAASQSPAPETLPTKATPTPSQTMASPVPPLTATPAAPSGDSRFDTPIPTAEAGVPIVPADDIPTVANITLQPSSPTGATPLAQLTSPSLPNNPHDLPGRQPVSAAAQSQSSALPAAETFISVAQPPVIPVPPPAVSDKNVQPLEPPAQMQPSIPQSSGSKVNSVPVSFRSVDPTATEPTLTVASAPRDSVPVQPIPVQPHASDIKIAAPETSDLPAARSATNDATSDAKNIVSSLTSNLFISNLTPNSNPAAPSTAPPVGANDAAGSEKAGVAAQVSSTAASQPIGADKKSIPTIQTNTTPNAASASGSASSGSSSSSISSGGPPVTGSSPSVPVVIAPARETSMLGTAPAPTASSSVPAPQTSSDASPLLPQAHQMLDSAPAAPMVPATPVVPGSAADLQVNSQMHMGVRTDAFGAVEIHTVVQQSQIGITVHADRDISRWFSSEVPGLESGLNNSHLNLTGVNFDHGRSGVQTATGFSNGHPRQNSSQTPSSPSAGLRGATSPEPAVATESATVDIFPSDRSSGPAGNHFSVHV